MHSVRKGRPRADEVPRELLDLAVEGDHIQVSRFSAGAWNYAGSYDPMAVRHVGLEEFVRLRGGGGKYRARIRRSDGTFGPSATKTIEGLTRPWAEPDATSSATSASSATVGPAPSTGAVGVFEKFLGPFAAAAGTAIATLLAKKLLEDPKADPLMLELLKRSGGAAVDPLELQNAIAAAEARGEARGRELGELRVKAAQPAADPGAGAGAAGAIERGLPKVLDTVHRYMDLEERRLAPRQLTAAADAAPSTPAEPVDPLVSLLLGVPIIARKFLFSAAEGDEPAEMYAQLVLGKLDDVTAARLPALLERADFADVFVATYPSFADFRPWVDQFVVALREAVADPGEGDDEEDDDAGDVTDTPAAAP